MQKKILLITAAIAIAIVVAATCIIYVTNNNGDTDAKGVVYNGNGGTAFGDHSTITDNSGITLIEGTFSKFWFTQTEWNTKADGTGKSYKFSEKVEGEDTLYAIWERNCNKFTLNFCITDEPPKMSLFHDGITDVIKQKESIEVKNREDVTLIVPVSISSEIVFNVGDTYTVIISYDDGVKKRLALDLMGVGHLKTTHTDKEYRVSFGLDADSVFLNTMHDKTSTVFLMGNGGITEYGSNFSMRVNIPVASEMFSRADYKLVGWNTERDDTGKSYTTRDVITEPIILYAIWEKEVRPTSEACAEEYNEDSKEIPTTKISNEDEYTIAIQPLDKYEYEYTKITLKAVIMKNGTPIDEDDPIYERAKFTWYTTFNDRAPSVIEHGDGVKETGRYLIIPPGPSIDDDFLCKATFDEEDILSDELSIDLAHPATTCIQAGGRLIANGETIEIGGGKISFLDGNTLTIENVHIEDTKDTWSAFIGAIAITYVPVENEDFNIIIKGDNYLSASRECQKQHDKPFLKGIALGFYCYHNKNSNLNVSGGGKLTAEGGYIGVCLDVVRSDYKTKAVTNIKDVTIDAKSLCTSSALEGMGAIMINSSVKIENCTISCKASTTGMHIYGYSADDSSSIKNCKINVDVCNDIEYVMKHLAITVGLFFGDKTNVEHSKIDIKYAGSRNDVGGGIVFIMGLELTDSTLNLEASDNREWGGAALGSNHYDDETITLKNSTVNIKMIAKDGMYGVNCKGLVMTDKSKLNIELKCGDNADIVLAILTHRLFIDHSSLNATVDHKIKDCMVDSDDIRIVLSKEDKVYIDSCGGIALCSNIKPDWPREYAKNYTPQNTYVKTEWLQRNYTISCYFTESLDHFETMYDFSQTNTPTVASCIDLEYKVDDKSGFNTMLIAGAAIAIIAILAATFVLYRKCE